MKKSLVNLPPPPEFRVRPARELPLWESKFVLGD